MKKTLAILLTAVMLISLVATMGFSASAADVLYEVNFNGDTMYQPWAFHYGNAAMGETAVAVSDGGKTLVLTAPADTSTRYFYGSAINGLEIGPGNQYTMTMKVAFPTGNAGVFFNFGDPDRAADPISDKTYYWIYGLYGQIKAGDCMTLCMADGSKCTGEKISNAGRYTSLPAGIENDAGGFVNVRIEIDGLFYAVFFNDILYDQMWMNEKVVDHAPHLGFTVYLYNKGAEVTVKDVVVKKGVTYGSSNSTNKYTKLDYTAFNVGDKIIDLTFDAKEGPYQALAIQDAKPDAVMYDVQDNGKTIDVYDISGGQAHWYGNVIHGLWMGDGYQYTISFRLRELGSKTAGGIAYNGMDGNTAGGQKYNWYGSFTNGGSPYLKFSQNGSNFADYNYPGAATGGENNKAFEGYVPAVDADGFTQLVVEIDGWNYSVYLIDSLTKAQVLAQTVDVKDVVIHNNLEKPYWDAMELGFFVYTYNASLEVTVKNASVYKGLVASQHTELLTELENPPTEAPTQPQDQPTEAPTQPQDQPTEAPTQPQDQPTEAPTQPQDEPTQAPEQPTEAPKDDKGCGSAVACGIALAAILGTAYVARKKF